MVKNRNRQMIQAAYNNIFISVKTKYISNISNLLKIAAIENNSSVDPTDIVQIVGKVESLPKKITHEKRGYEGFTLDNILVGDTIIFRFDVIYSFIQKAPDTDKVFANQNFYEGKEYFACDIQKVFGVIRDEKIWMVNGYVMVSDYELPKIVLAASAKKARGSQKSQILHVGGSKRGDNPLDVETGDAVFFNPNHAAKYQILGKPFRILQQGKILGKEIN